MIGSIDGLRSTDPTRAGTTRAGTSFADRPLTPTLSPQERGEGEESIRPGHLEHGVRPYLKLAARAPGAHDRARQRGLVDAVLDKSLVDMDGDDLAEGKPGLRLLAIGALQLNDLRQFAFERDRAFRHARHVDARAGGCRQSVDLALADVVGDMRRGRVHLLRQILGREIPDELFG